MSESRPTASVLVTGSELLTGHVADDSTPVRTPQAIPYANSDVPVSSGPP